MKHSRGAVSSHEEIRGPERKELSASRRRFMQVGGALALALPVLGIGVEVAVSEPSLAGADKGPEPVLDPVLEGKHRALLEAVGVSFILSAAGQDISRIDVAANATAFPMPTVWIDRPMDDSLESQSTQLLRNKGMDLIARSAGSRPRWKH